MSETTAFGPLRTLRDVEELERVPLDDRIFSWNLNDWIFRGLDLDPDKVAISYIEDGDPAREPVEISYRALKRQTIQAANLFHSLGLPFDKPVLFLLPNVPQLFPVMLGAITAGIACSVNWLLKPEQWVELARACGAPIIVALGPTPGFSIWEGLQSVRGDLPAGTHILSVVGPGGATVADSDFDSLCAGQSGERLTFTRKVAPDDIAAYIHSGGTTGSPKLVRLPHRGFCYKCWVNSLVMNHTADDVIFADYPMFHIAGFFGRGVMAIADGMSIVIPSVWGARDKTFVANYWKFVETYRISVLAEVPTTLSQLAKNPPRGEDVSSLRAYGVTGSTAFPSEVARQLEKAVGVRMLATYGATEYTQNVTQAPRDGEPKYGSAGLRFPYTSVKTVEIDGNGAIKRDCAIDETGVVIIKGPSVTPGYLDAKYNVGLFKDGWFVSGDVGRIDADGYLWLTGRIKDVIIRGGHNIDPSMIEEALLRHPEVMLAAAVSKPDAHSGEVPVAYVQLVDGAKATAADLIAFAQEHVPERAAVPKDIFIVDRMPLTDVGKPQKAQLRVSVARKTYNDALAGVAGAETIEVDIVPDPTKGTMAIIQVSGADGSRREVESRIAEVMGAYPVAFTVRWMENAVRS